MPQLIEPGTGKLRDVSDQDAAGAIAAGWKPETTEDVNRLSTGIANEANYGGVLGGVNAALAGLARGATIGGSDVLGRLIGGEDTARTLEGLQAQNPIISGASEFAGVLLPSVVSGGAAAPAGMVSALGRKVTAGAIREGAGLAERVAGHAVGAAAEGGIFGGGQYLSQTALENKPLSAEGFVGGMGKGALFAVPVAGAFAIGGKALIRARSLFPRSQITAKAGLAAKTEASSALQQSITDGESMAQSARQKIALADAQAGRSGARTQVTRAVFGGADPAELGAQVEGAANKAQLVDALGKFEESHAALKDWIAAGGDAELEASMAGLRGGDVQRPEQGALALLGDGSPAPRVPVGEFGVPGVGGVKGPGTLARAAADAGGPEAAAVAPTEPSPSTSVIRKGRAASEPPSINDIGPSDPNATSAFKLSDSGLQFDPKKRSYFDPSGKAMEATPVGEMNLGLSPRVTPEDVTGIRGAPSSEAAAIPERAKISAHESATGADMPQTIPAKAIAERGYYEPPGGGADSVKASKAKSAIAEGQRDPVKLTLSPEGKILVTDGRHRLAAAIEADAPIKIEWSAGAEPAASDVLRGGAKAADAGGDLEALLRGTQDKLSDGANLNDIGAPSRAKYAADKAVKTEEAAAHFRGKANAENFAGSEMGAVERVAQGEAAAQRQPSLPDSHSELGKLFGIDLAPTAEKSAGNLADLQSLLSRWSDENVGTIVDKAMKARMGPIADDAAIEKLLQKRPGKNVNVGPQLERAAKVIGDHEAASADLAGLLGSDAPKGAADRAQALQAARRAQAEAHGASSAKAAQNIQDRAMPAMADRTVVTDDVAQALQKHESAVEGAKDRALVSMQRAESKAAAKAAEQVAPTEAPARGVGSKLADVGTALEVMKALGVHVPALSAIPVIGPVLGLFLKARAVLGILGRKGGSIGRDVDGVIAAKAAATRERIATATQAILTGAGKGALKISEISAGPAVTLGYKLFPGPNITNSKDPQKLYEARMDEIVRAQQPGAIDHAIADRYQTSDPNLHDAIVQQTARGIAFLDSKAPKPSIMQSMLPGDGIWRPSKAQLDEWGKYVHAVGDPASVLEDLAKGHVTLEGAETLRVVYPELFAEGQKLLMQAAPQMQKTLPYPTRVAISILYRIPLDGSMAPGHLQYLQQGQLPASGGPPAGGAGPAPGGPPAPPGLTGPIKLGQSTMTSLDRRAGS